jgi:hypothetical protein
MTAKDLFGVIVRMAGLFITFSGIAYFLSGIFRSLSPNDPSGHQDFTYGIVSLVVGLYFLRGAPLLMRYCYPDHR